MEPELARDARIAYGSSGRLERAEKAGRLDRVRPGVFVSSDWNSATHRERHLLKMRAATRVLTTRLVFSHESAAAVHGIPVVGTWPDRICVSYDGSAGRAPRVGVRWTRAAWDEGDVEVVAGFVVTSARRTALDLARTGSPAQAVAALDWVLARGEQRGVLAEWLSEHRPIRGAHQLERALGIARGLSESPLESLSLARFAQLGFAQPSQQYEVSVDGQIYRLDFVWEGAGIAGEADGILKYLEPGDLWREKRREDAIRRQVSAFIRWSWADAWHGEPLARILAAAQVPRL
jgi:hypothetical protein